MARRRKILTAKVSGGKLLRSQRRSLTNRGGHKPRKPNGSYQWS